MFSRSQSLIVVSSVLAVLASIAVALRFLARRLKGLRIWVDDYLIVIALVRNLIDPTVAIIAYK